MAQTVERSQRERRLRVGTLCSLSLRMIAAMLSPSAVHQSQTLRATAAYSSMIS
jgi:hypothetical protein